MSLKNVIIIRNAKSYDFGGAERFPVFLAEVLKLNNLRPLIISRSQKLLAFAEDNNIKTVRGWWWSNQNWNGKKALLFPIYLTWQLLLTAWYLQLFIRLKPSIVHIQSKDDFISGTFAGKLLGKRVIWTDHADLKHIWKNHRAWYKNPVGKLVYFSAKFADGISVVSKSELELVSHNLMRKSTVKNKLQVIYNGIIDISSKYKNTTNGDIFKFCSVSRMVTDKGISELIEAFERLSSKHHNLELVLIGDGPEEQKFRDMARNSKNIQFLGYQKDPLTYMENADVFVHPTYHEGFSVSLVEAAMLGLPIIATGVGGNVEIIKNGETGLLTPAKDPQALYDAMGLLYNDKKLRQTLAFNARKQYEHRFQFDKIVKNEFIPMYEGDKK